MNVPTFLIPVVKRQVPQSAVVRFEAYGNYTLIYVEGEGSPILYSRCLLEMCARYPFMVRVSRHHAVNPQRVERTQHWNVIRVDGMPIKLVGRYSPVLRSGRLPQVNSFMKSV
ncbi:LytTR family transcriptional regulator [Fibrella forsythiae]|uniref:LytTR family transcriptional regulator n=1 Tax=Fibrella forsythiae TaxID=2817061 RepID=A0ABS3JC28_9BACT|nr:LytTR family transcriptional regulator [Fibrella forsythiae]MBO0947547.1 LytTR family transcriptional regulator [Fibrella forsythiae]